MMSLTLSNKQKANNLTMVREKNLSTKEKHLEATLQKSSEAAKGLLLPRYKESLEVYNIKHIADLESRVQQLNQTLNDIVHKTYSY